jgi:hypothetical protein
MMIRVRALKARGLGATEIAKELEIGRASVYRVLDQVDVRPGAASGGRKCLRQRKHLAVEYCHFLSC